MISQKLMALKLSQLLLVASCAGPTNPFGSTDNREKVSYLPEHIFEREVFRSPAQATYNYRTNNDIKIEFFPKKMNFHSSEDFSIIISDEKRKIDLERLKLIYNGTDILDQVLDVSKIEKQNNGKKLKLTVKGMRFLVNKKNEIAVSYRRKMADKLLLKKYHSPSCSFNNDQILYSNYMTNNFKGHIHKASDTYNINPNMLEALIEQESNTNIKKVSNNKELGLMQLGTIPEILILKENDSWPRYSQIDELSPSTIKTLIYMGKINQNNEWRLNPELSILGGAKYLDYLKAYWEKPENMNILKKHHRRIKNDLMTDLVLASFDSGPYRVRNSLFEKGKDWRNSNQLKDTMNYVNLVKSRCYHLASR